MQESDKYRQTKITRGDLISRIKNYKQGDWIKALNRLDVVVRTDYDRGSHAVVYKHGCSPDDSRCLITTIKKDLHSEIQRDLFKKILAYGLETGRYDENDIWKALGIKIKK